MKLFWAELDYWIRWLTEKDITTMYFWQIRKDNPWAFIWKIPDVGSNMKPCDGFWMFNKNEIYAVEIKVNKEKRWRYDPEKFEQDFVSLMEPIQITTFNTLHKIGIPCVMVLYNKYTHLFYSFIYKDDQKRKETCN